MSIMDPLEEQLRQLSILNNRVGVAIAGSDDNIAAKYMGGSKVAALVSSLETAQMTGGNAVGLSDTYNTKKVGPLVPPKPHKKKSNIPEIPQSSLVKQVCEPLYSQRLQCVDAGATNDVMGRAPLLLRKQPIYAGSSLYDGSVSSKVTLDNPAILDQQLEALEHHKKQLERKALFLQQQQQQEPLQQQSHTVSSIPKLSSTSLLNVSQSMKPHQPIENNLVYTNVLKGPHIKAGSELAEYTPTNNIYCNVLYGKSVAFEDDINKPKILSNNDATEYDDVDEDEVPSPPSPVSSSYSELRRATNVFAATAHPLQQQVQQSQAHFVAPLDVATSSTDTTAMIAPPTTAAAAASAALQQQTYMNMHMRYNNEYNSYSPSLQSISQDSSDYYGYGSFSQGTSTYESIYEPINPRPPSQSSIRSNYLMYSPYINGGQLPDARGLSTAVNSTCGSGDGVLSNSTSADLSTLAGSLQSSGANTPLHAGCGSLPHAPKTSLNHQKEAEVEALTDFLVHSMDAPSDADIYGICYKCNERVLGETSGCTAMDQIYHITCFTCSECQINLQGKPFYALEGKPYCEYDYLQTLEKCSVCMKPILERILRATGKPYHPQCFTCVVCGKSLDGITFTVDATNQNYCIADFHKKFAPRCCVCKEPIMPEPGEEETVRVVALDRSFHFECYKCEDCGLLLSSEAEGRGCYPLDNHVLCKSCNAKRVQMLTNRMTTEL